MLISDEIYCITAAKNADKRRYIDKQMKYFGLNYKFVYGIDADFTKQICNFPIYASNSNDEQETKARHLSCDLANYTAILAAYNDGLDRVFIIEDDAQFIKDTEYIKYCINNIPDDADIVKFGFTYSQKHLEDIESIVGENLFIKDIYTVSTVGYMICNRETMKNIIDTYANCIVQADSYDIFNCHKYNVYNLKMPFIISNEVHYIYESYLDLNKYYNEEECK